MNGSFKVYAPHYFGKPALKPEFVSQFSRELVKPNEIMSGMPEPNTITSWPYNLSMPQHPRLIIDADGSKYAAEKTSGRRYVIPYSEYLKLGPATQFDDLGFESWKAVGEEPQLREYVRIPLKSSNPGLIESFGERQLKLAESDTPVNLFVHDFSYNGPINDFGRFSHQVRNLKQHLMEYYGMKSAQELVSFLKSRGLTLKEIDYLATGFIPKGFVYGVNKVNGKRILFASEDAYESNARDARAFGLDTEDIRAFGFDEEQIHLARDNYTSSLAKIIAEEIATKSIARDFYIKMAIESQGNPELVRKYAILAALKEEDIRTTRKVYTRIHKEHRADLEEIADESDERHAAQDVEYAAQNGLAGKVVSISRYLSQRSRGREAMESKEKGKVYDARGRLDKSRYASREAESPERTDDARSDKGSPDAKDSGDARGEPAEGGEPSRGEAQAEAA